MGASVSSQQVNIQQDTQNQGSSQMRVGIVRQQHSQPRQYQASRTQNQIPNVQPYQSSMQIQNQMQRFQHQQSLQHSHLVPQGPIMPIMNPARLSVFNNPVSLRINSLKLNQNIQESNKNTISFQFDTTIGIEIQVYAFVSEKSDPITDLTTEYYNYLLMDKQTFDKPGKNQEYITRFFIEFNKIKEVQLKSISSGFWPLIIRLATQETSSKIMFYYFEFEKNASTYKIKFKRQKLEFNQAAFEVQEIYGIAGSGLVQEEESKSPMDQAAMLSDQDKECIICFCEKIDTVIMPCRHMCICIKCASLFQEKQKESVQQRQKTNNCPVCRKEIESFIKIQSKGE